MSVLRTIATIWALCVALLGTPGATLAQPGGAIGGTAAWPWPVHGPFGPYMPYGPYPYGGYAPWGPCGPGLCSDSIEMRRAVRRELQLQELRRELELRAGGGLLPREESPYGVRRDPPAPTPESELQPRYRGSGEVRPEYRNAGRAR